MVRTFTRFVCQWMNLRRIPRGHGEIEFSPFFAVLETLVVPSSTPNHQKSTKSIVRLSLIDVFWREPCYILQQDNWVQHEQIPNPSLQSEGKGN